MKLSMVPIFNLLWKWGKKKSINSKLFFEVSLQHGVVYLECVYWRIFSWSFLRCILRRFFFVDFFEFCTRLCSFLILISIFRLLQSCLDVHACYKIFVCELSIVVFITIIFFSFSDIWHIFFFWWLEMKEWNFSKNWIDRIEWDQDGC